MSKRRKSPRGVEHRGMVRQQPISETKLLQAIGLPTIDDLRRQAREADAAARKAEFEAFREARRQEEAAAEMRARWAAPAVKPRIVPAAGGWWRCFADPYFGAYVGRTPDEAYAGWLAAWRPAP